MAKLFTDAPYDKYTEINCESLTITDAESDGARIQWTSNDSLSIAPRVAGDYITLGGSSTDQLDVYGVLTNRKSIISDSGALTLTAAQVLGTSLIHSAPQGNVNWTLCSASDLVAAVKNAAVGQTVATIQLYNAASAASGAQITIVPGTGGTLLATTATLSEGVNVSGILTIVLSNVTSGSEAYYAVLVTNS